MTTLEATARACRSVLFVAGLALVSARVEANTVCDPPLEPTQNGATAATALVVSQVVPGTGIELFNASSADVDLDVTDWRVVAGESQEVVADIAAGDLTVRSGWYRALSWPAGFEQVVDPSGEMALWLGSDFDDGSQISDFVCWGAAVENSKKALA
jgi:hypothetical protein